MARRQGIVEFESIVRRHQGMVYSIAYHILHDRATAEEVAQDVFLQLYRRLDDITSDEHAVSWLRRAAVHRSIDRARQQDTRSEIPLDDAPEPLAQPDAADPFLGRRLRQLVASLPEKARAVVVLRYQEDLDPTDIARTLEMPLATVKSHLQRALAMLREKVSRTLGELKT